MGDYDELARDIIDLVGGSKNITSLTHCVTRLRFRLVDDGLADKEALDGLDGVVSTIVTSGQFQVVIGAQVGDVFDAVNALLEPDGEHEGLTAERQPGPGGIKGLRALLVGIVTDVFAPYFGLMAAFGILKGILALLVGVGLLESGGSTYNVLYSLADAFFYFMPILLGYTASKRFGLPVGEGMLIGAGMLYPTISSSSTLAHDSLFGIPMVMPQSGNYATSVIPIICAVAFAAWFERLYAKHVPGVVKPFVVPLITCTVTFVLTMLVLGPIMTWVTDGLASLFALLQGGSELLFGVVLGSVWQIVLVFGLHWAVLPIIMTNLSTNGFDLTLASTFGCNFAQIGALAAIWLKCRDKKTKGLCPPSMLSAAFGVIEPAIFGVTLQRRAVFVVTCAVSALVGVGMSLCGVRAYGVTGFGIFGFASFIDPTTNDMTGLMWAVIWAAIAVVVSFAAVFVLYRDGKAEDEVAKEPETSL